MNAIRRCHQTFDCTTCGDGFGRTYEQMMDHLESVHNLLPGALGKQKLTLHVDTAKEHFTNYEWTIGKIVFQQAVRVESRMAFKLRQLKV